MIKKELLKNMMKVFEENCQDVIKDLPACIDDFEVTCEGITVHGAFGLRFYLENLANEVVLMYNPNSELTKLFDDASDKYISKIMKGLLGE